MMRTTPHISEGGENSLIDNVKLDYFAHLKTTNPGGVDEGTYRACYYYYSAELLPLLSPNKRLRILDVGCGFGHLIRFCSELGYKRVTGVEIDQQLFQAASGYVGSMAESLVNANAQEFLENNPNSFDVIILFEVIEHFTLEQAIEITTLICKALQRGGIAIFRTPNMANLFGGYSRYIDLTHQYGYTEYSLAQLLRQSGFATPQLHLPKWEVGNPLTRKLRLSRWIHQLLIGLQDRSNPRCFEKNIVMWAIRTS
jgi:2-polyprenyl-3-methyl-5-hydroxy-6-metoxy-1,4-benzoquinol methylase